MNREPKLTAILLALGLAVTAIAASGCSKENANGGTFTMPPMPVEVAHATVQTVTDRFDAVGTFEAMEAITVVSEIDAAVVALPFR